MIAAEYLRRQGWTSVGYGDSGLLHEIADQLGMPHEGPFTEKKVLDRIDRTHGGVFKKWNMRFPERGLGRTRRFTLLESA